MCLTLSFQFSLARLEEKHENFEFVDRPMVIGSGVALTDEFDINWKPEIGQFGEINSRKSRTTKFKLITVG